MAHFRRNPPKDGFLRAESSHSHQATIKRRDEIIAWFERVIKQSGVKQGRVEVVATGTSTFRVLGYCKEFQAWAIKCMEYNQIKEIHTALDTKKNAKYPYIVIGVIR